MITNYQANNIMNLLFGKTNYEVPANLYLGLSTTNISVDGTGATEPSGAGYSRVEIANNKTSFDEAANGKVVSKIQVTFPESTGSWGTVTHVFVADAAENGNVLYFDELASARIVQEASSLTFPAGELAFSLTNKAE